MPCVAGKNTPTKYKITCLFFILWIILLLLFTINMFYRVQIMIDRYLQSHSSIIPECII